MGPYDPKTKQAWQEINERFGKCPKCGTEPFESYTAVKSYSKPSLYVLGTVIALASSNVITIATSSDKLPEIGEYVAELSGDSQSSGLAKVSEAVISADSDVSNVTIRDDGTFQCEDCAAVWDPDHWNISLRELGLITYNY